VIQTVKGTTTFRQTVRGNVVFAGVPLTGGSQVYNTVGQISDAEKFLVRPRGRLGEFDLRPRQGRLHGPPLEMAGLSRYENWRQDFDGNHRDLTIRGAYGTDNSSSGWQPLIERKPVIEQGH